MPSAPGCQPASSSRAARLGPGRAVSGVELVDVPVLQRRREAAASRPCSGSRSTAVGHRLTVQGQAEGPADADVAEGRVVGVDLEHGSCAAARPSRSRRPSAPSSRWRLAGSIPKVTSAWSLSAISARVSARPTAWNVTFSTSGAVPRQSVEARRLDRGGQLDGGRPGRDRCR